MFGSLKVRPIKNCKSNDELECELISRKLKLAVDELKLTAEELENEVNKLKK